MKKVLFRSLSVLAVVALAACATLPARTSVRPDDSAAAALAYRFDAPTE